SSSWRAVPCPSVRLAFERCFAPCLGTAQHAIEGSAPAWSDEFASLGHARAIRDGLEVVAPPARVVAVVDARPRRRVARFAQAQLDVRRRSNLESWLFEQA